MDQEDLQAQQASLMQKIQDAEAALRQYANLQSELFDAYLYSLEAQDLAANKATLKAYARQQALNQFNMQLLEESSQIAQLKLEGIQLRRWLKDPTHYQMPPTRFPFPKPVFPP